MCVVGLCQIISRAYLSFLAISISSVEAYTIDMFLLFLFE